MWKIDTTRIFVSESDEETSTIIARLQPVVSGTVLQIFGHESPVRSIGGVVVGSGNAQNLKDYANDGNTHTLSGPYGFRDYYISKVQLKQRISIKQTLMGNLPSDASVYDFDMELYE